MILNSLVQTTKHMNHTKGNTVHPVVGGLNRRPGARLCRRPAAALGQGNALRLVEDDTAALPPTTSGGTEGNSESERLFRQ